ncbi:hypothetical protein [Cellulomonas sp. HZM]|uniref:hypothetical protein n=1 Tax=Cellulomonas sp. HZM TaxID=1454010 RepID=UPI0004933B93|nr:hypothetical protein [Cellulomonas sp. HZM]
MSERRWFELTDVDSDETMTALAGLADLTWQDMGEVRATFRAWPGTVAWVVIAALVGGGGVAALAAGDPATRVVALAVVATVAVFLAAFVAAGAADRTRVCEHGLVLGTRTRSRYVVPWSTLDPGRVRVVHHVGLVGRLPYATPSSPHYRLGLLSTRALAVDGLDTALGGWARVPGMLEVTDAVAPGSRVRRTPFVWWLLGTRRPADLARAIEDAMVADGYPARGLAARAQAQAHTMRLNPGTHDPLPPRAATDPVLGVDGPDLP